MKRDKEETEKKESHHSSVAGRHAELKEEEEEEGGSGVLDGQQDLQAHVFPLLHELAVDEDLVCADPIANGVSRIGG
jgi:hypothetical protein